MNNNPFDPKPESNLERISRIGAQTQEFRAQQEESLVQALQNMRLNDVDSLALNNIHKLVSQIMDNYTLREQGICEFATNMARELDEAKGITTPEPTTLETQFK